MFQSILVVCVGNICRSPVGERVLQAGLPGCRVGSAGLGAVVGSGADPKSAAAAAARGIDLEGHVARQFTAQLAGDYELILTMEPGHRDDIQRRYPQLSGRVMLFDQWGARAGIPDPHGRPAEAHEQAVAQILEAAEGWISRLGTQAAR
ncbi:MAG: low molecular weight phosphotyrosine protein phosphatase [Allgaiera sp.]|jgi:protein-tyrosine phosphatase|nr:low molecular weight phosphotyrosine protein phosphatase [Allgaiera sp.]